MTAEINVVEMQKMMQRINELKRWVLEAINKIDKPLAKEERKKKLKSIQ